MVSKNAGYFAINHPIDFDPVCGYNGDLSKGVCPRCGRKEFEGVPAYKLLELHSYRPSPLYAVKKSMIEDEETIPNSYGEQ